MDDIFLPKGDEKLVSYRGKMAVAMRSGGWTLTESLESSVFLTTDPEWVVKRIPFDMDRADPSTETCEELEATLAIYNNRRRIRNVPSFPRSVSDFCGIERDHAWFAMRRYDGSLSVIPGASIDPDFWGRHWRRLAIQVLAFLEDLHTICRRVHMDIKGTNILVDYTACQFVVTDYGLSCYPGRRSLSDYSADFLWYYLEFGAELDKPIASWRFDLTALGYLLARLCWDPANDITFIEICQTSRRQEGTKRQTPAHVIAIRSIEMARGVSPLLYAYFEMLDAVSWYEPEPPPGLFYKSLASLFA